MCRLREVCHAQHRLVLKATHIRDDLAILGPDEIERTAPEALVLATDRERAACPVEERGRIAALRLDVDGLIAVDRIHDDRQVQTLRVGAREAGIAIEAPLHRRTHAIAIADVDIVAHADLIAVVHDGRTGHGKQQAIHELDAIDIVVQKRREAAANTDVHAHARLLRVHLVHVVALAIRHHLERELVVIAQEDGPLTVIRNIGRLAQDFRNRITILERHGHENARHQRKVECHVAFVAFAEILAHVFRPLVRFGQEHPILIVRIHHRTHLLQHHVGLGQVLVIRAFRNAEVRDRIQAQSVHAHVEPEAHDIDDRVDDLRIVVIQIGLMREEPMPVVAPRDRVPCPVRGFGIREDDARPGEFLVGVAPDIELVLRRSRRGSPCRLKPGVLIGGVIDHQLRDHAQAAQMGLLHEPAEVIERAVVRMHVPVIGNVVAIIALRRWVERQQPDGVDAQFLNVIEFLDQPREIADAIAVGIVEGLDVHLIDDRVLVPKRIRCSFIDKVIVGCRHACAINPRGLPPDTRHIYVRYAPQYQQSPACPPSALTFDMSERVPTRAPTRRG